jgi:hypothetical protein
MIWWNVLFDGATHGCELPDEEPPKPGQERMLGDLLARIHDVTTGPDGGELIVANRLPDPGRE